MKYDKPPLTFDQQADQLIKRGLIVDKTFLIDRLKNVNYYRLQSKNINPLTMIGHMV